MRAVVLLTLLSSTAALAQRDPDPWFAPDKALHFSFSVGLAGLSYGGAALVTEDRGVRLAVGAGVALTAGVVKELLDLSGLGHPSWKDLAWDVAGTAVGLVVSWLLDRFVFTPLHTRSPPFIVPESPGVGGRLSRADALSLRVSQSPSSISAAPGPLVQPQPGG